MLATDEWVTTQELAAELKVPVQTLHTWRYRRQGPEGTRFGKHIRYRRSVVIQWIADQEARQAEKRTA